MEKNVRFLSADYSKLTLDYNQSTVDYFNNNRHEIWLAAIRGDSVSLQQIQNLHKTSVREAAQNTILTKITRLIQEEYSFNSKILPRINLQTNKGRTSPLPKTPDCFTQFFPDPIKAISYFFSGSKLKCLVDSILKNSTFVSSIGQGFQTISKNDKSVILGENKNLVRNVRSLAHELGHCIYENTNPGWTFKNLVISEFVAITCEVTISNWIFQSLGYLEIENKNTQYTQQIMYLNEYFMHKEIHDIMYSSWEYSEYVNYDLCVFRKSYITATGLQLVYGIANSLIGLYNIGSSKNEIIGHIEDILSWT